MVLYSTDANACQHGLGSGEEKTEDPHHEPWFLWDRPEPTKLKIWPKALFAFT